MNETIWQALILSPTKDGHVYELFHENSKTSRYAEIFSEEEVVARMKGMWESLPYDLHPVVDLPHSLTPLQVSLQEAILARSTPRRIEPALLTLENLTTVLHGSYGINRENVGTQWPRPFRTVPSGGALYPLEIYFHTLQVRDLPVGLYHYNPSRNNLRLLLAGDQRRRIAEGMVQPELAEKAAVIFFITAMFERTTFKYGDRGYRFALLEAGHVAQNINLLAKGLGLGSVNIGGFFDRQIDDLLGLDGVTHSTIYMAAIGKPIPDSEAR